MANLFPVSIITPVYNEEEIIESSIRKNLGVLNQFPCEYEMIIVDDGSTDKSYDILSRCFSNQKKITILRNEKNLGFGGTVARGISCSKLQHILCIPADSPLSVTVFQGFLDAADKADIIVSYRIERKGYSAIMSFNSAVFHFLVSNLFNMRLRDYNWIHMYNRKIFDGGGIKIDSQGLFMLAEVLIKAKRKGYSFYEFPVEQEQRLTGIATAAKLSAMIKTFGEMLRFFWSK